MSLLTDFANCATYNSSPGSIDRLEHNSRRIYARTGDLENTAVAATNAALACNISCNLERIFTFGKSKIRLSY